jgi:Putative auto-transporter adhesin, head GIN domain
MSYQEKMEGLSMKKLSIAAMFCAVTLFMFAGCHVGVKGTGVRKTEQRDVGSFTAIDASGMLDVEVTCQKPVSVEVEGDDNLLPLIQTEVVNGVLRIKSTRNYRSRDGIVVRITVPNLERVEAKGAGKIQVADLKNDRFEIHSSGVVTVFASGETKSLEINESGAGHMDTHKLQAAAVNVSLSGAGDVDVYASDTLEVSVSGAAHVTYSGNPTVTKHVSGAASVSKKESHGV